MMKKHSLIGIFILVLLPLQAQNQIGTTKNDFAFDLLQKVNANENFCYSPYSISSAVAMTYAGAAGTTKEQIEKVFHFKDLSSTNSMYKELYMKLIKSSVNNTTLNVANSMWIQKDLELQENYVNAISENYYTSAFQVDYKQETEKARSEINEWVSEKTEKRITNLLQPGVVSPLTRLVLVNAIYFKAPWKKQFKKEQTVKDDFFLGKKSKIEVDFMKENITLNYTDNKLFSAIELPYENEEIAMLVIVPKSRRSMKKISKKINGGWFESLNKSMKPNHVEVNMPKFEFRNNISLKHYLSKMGMPIAFNNDADFSGITGDMSLKIDDVIHEAYINVNEEGTEAAAATAVVMRAKSFIKKDKPIVFKANKPYYFIIKENNTDVILFLGKVANPNN